MPNVYGSALPHLPTSLLVWLATTDLRLWVYGLRSIYGVFRFLHLTGMAGFLGLLLLIEVRRLGLFRDSSIASARLPIFTLMNTAFGLTLVTGIALFLYDPIGVGLHTMFLPKLLLIVLGLVHAYAVEPMETMKRPIWRPLSAGIALGIWILVMAASTWNAVERPVNPADIQRRDPRVK